MTVSAPKSRQLSFLHTAAAHVATFDRLVGEIAPATPARHAVAQDLLDDILAVGGTIDASMRHRIETAVRAAAGSGDLVVCTCSTLGGVVEEIGQSSGIEVLRIDRALAEAAVAAGNRILVAMTAISTLPATQALFQEVAHQKGIGADFRFEMIEGVFDLFFAGRIDAYAEAIAEAVRSRLADADVVVLAQASMAAAYPHLSDLNIPVLVSGRAGVERALSLLRGL